MRHSVIPFKTVIYLIYIYILLELKRPKTVGVGGAVVNSDEEKILDYGDQPPLLPPKREGFILIFFSNQG